MGVPRILPPFFCHHLEKSALPSHMHINPRLELDGSNCPNFATKSHRGPAVGRVIAPGVFNVADGLVFGAWSGRSIQREGIHYQKGNIGTHIRDDPWALAFEDAAVDVENKSRGGKATE